MKPVVISLDDIPSVSYGPILKLNEMGIPTTLFVSLCYAQIPGYLNMTQLKQLSISNEIACHTYYHEDVLSFKGSFSDWMEHMYLNKQEILKNFGLQSTSFAYPKGRYSKRHLRKLRKVYNVQRITRNGKNTNRRLSRKRPVYSIPLYGENHLEIIEKIEKDRGDFISLYTHDICTCPSEFGITEDAFFNVINYLISKNYKFMRFDGLYTSCSNRMFCE